MAAITIHDLPASRKLDRGTMSRLRGGGAPWVFGWIRPFAPDGFGTPTVVNFFQINNSFQAEQMINQFQLVDVRNSAPGADIDVVLTEGAANTRP